MKISCPNCSAAYELDDSRVPPAGLSIKCPKCKNPFTVHKQKPGDAAKKGAVPLPGQAGGKPPAAAAKPQTAAPKPGAKGPGAVPLPGAAAGSAEQQQRRSVDDALTAAEPAPNHARRDRKRGV